MEKVITEFPNYTITSNGTVRNRDGRIMHARSEHNGYSGYLTVRLWKNGKRYDKTVHKLVYETFVQKVPIGMHINHIDGNKLNPNLANLEMCTLQENNQRRLFLKRGEQVFSSKLTDDKVIDIKQGVHNGASKLYYANKYNVHISTVRKITRGASWKHITSTSTKQNCMN